MKIHPLLFLFFIGLCSCASLDVKEIKKLDRIPFDPLQIRPELEPNNLRIDVIRQSTTSYMGENAWNHTTDPYHPLGFDIGNGIFYDLNHNLSLRLDHFMEFAPDQEFSVEETNIRTKYKRSRVYTYRNDSLFLSGSGKNSEGYLFNKVGNQDSTSLMKKGRQLHGISKKDSTVTYYRTLNKELDIQQLDAYKYELTKRRNRETYQMIDGELFLRNLYSVHLLDNNKKIEIRAIHKNKSRLVSTIIRSQNEIFIYGRQYLGKRIKLENEALRLYTNKKPETEFRLNPELTITLTGR